MQKTIWLVWLHKTKKLNMKVRMQTTISLHNTKVIINTKYVCKQRFDYTTRNTYANNDLTTQHES